MHPLDPIRGRLARHSDDDLRGQSRLGDAAFDRLPEYRSELEADLEAIAFEPWEWFDPADQRLALSAFETSVDLLDEACHLSTASEGFQSRHSAIIEGVVTCKNEIRTTLRPKCLRFDLGGMIRREVASAQVNSEDIGSLREQLDHAVTDVADIRGRAQEIRDLEEALRKASGNAAATELAKSFAEKELQHRNRAIGWSGVLVILATLVGVYVWKLDPTPDGPLSAGRRGVAELVGHGLQHATILGLALYFLRLTGAQAKSQFHLFELARNRVTGLKTFRPLYNSVGEPEGRSELTRIIAESIFRSDDSGLVTGSDDHVTLIERVIPMMASRQVKS